MANPKNPEITIKLAIMMETFLLPIFDPPLPLKRGGPLFVFRIHYFFGDTQDYSYDKINISLFAGPNTFIPLSTLSF